VLQAPGQYACRCTDRRCPCVDPLLTIVAQSPRLHQNGWGHRVEGFPRIPRLPLAQRTVWRSVRCAPIAVTRSSTFLVETPCTYASITTACSATSIRGRGCRCAGWSGCRSARACRPRYVRWPRHRPALGPDVGPSGGQISHRHSHRLVMPGHHTGPYLRVIPRRPATDTQKRRSEPKMFPSQQSSQGDVKFVDAVREHLAAKEQQGEDRPRTLFPTVAPF
jgi:hypothetical protein